MYNCIWSLDIVFGKQKQALDIIKAWGAEKFKSSHFKVSKNRLSVGHIDESASHVVDEYLFESLADFEKAMDDMGQPQFRQFSDAIAPYIVPASQKWTVYKIIE